MLFFFENDIMYYTNEKFLIETVQFPRGSSFTETTWICYRERVFAIDFPRVYKYLIDPYI